MTLRDDSQAVLRSLEPVGAALRSIQDTCGPPDASLLNCCAPQAITRAMPEVVAYCRGVVPAHMVTDSGLNGATCRVEHTSSSTFHAVPYDSGEILAEQCPDGAGMALEGM